MFNRVFGIKNYKSCLRELERQKRDTKVSQKEAITSFMAGEQRSKVGIGSI